MRKVGGRAMLGDPTVFQGGFEFLLKNWYILEEFLPFYGSFPGVSLMMREVSHVCKCFHVGTSGLH